MVLFIRQEEMNTSINPFLRASASRLACLTLFGRIATLHGARSFAYQNGMSRSLCAMRLALHPEILNF
jgi:hypothetical protein